MTKHVEPFVSVLTPVYNGAEFLTECIESTLNQTYRNFEYIIVNNCSTDRTLDIAMAYAQKDARIRVHNNDKTVPVIENHNIAFRLISRQSKYCKVLSADDFIFPDCLTRMVEVGEVHPSVGIIGSYQLSGDVIRWQGFPYPASVMSGIEIGRRCFLQRQMVLNGQEIFGFGTPTSLLYRADLVRNSEAFYPNASPHADTSACFDQLRTCDFGFVYQILCYEKTHAETQTSASKELNRFVSACLNDYLVYGSAYLSQDEVESGVKATLDGYHRFLAKHYFLGRKDAAFWDYHRGRLEELGYPLKRSDLVKAGIGVALKSAVNPVEAMGKLWALMSPGPRTSKNGVAHASQSSAAAKTLAR